MWKKNQSKRVVVSLFQDKKSAINNDGEHHDIKLNKRKRYTLTEATVHIIKTKKQQRS